MLHRASYYVWSLFVVFTINALLRMAEYVQASISDVVGDEIVDIRLTDKLRKRSKKVSGSAHITHKGHKAVFVRKMRPDCR